ncbi:MAG: acyltransferase [Planctomycetota bacterium]|nr:acyltransferase [Planctomycetota bacterium]MDA1212876.1 acyltransferase [Planctomycetota bacterium]
MKSSTGKHFIALEHVRALAALLVFSWHFLHIHSGHVHPLPGTFWFPLNSLFAEGHTGVAIFMVLSGYLFSKITDGRKILYFPFIYNRILRLAPLLIAVLMAYGAITHVFDSADATRSYLARVLLGTLLPVLPNGGWSITIEFHFYLLFPLLLLLENKRKYSSLIFVVASVALRYWMFQRFGTERLQYLTYYTLIGRVDQFVLGILFYRYGRFLKERNLAAAAIAVTWVTIWYAFDRIGGFYRGMEYQHIWVVMTLLEGLFYGALISWYDRTFTFTEKGFSGLISKIGECSYSIYLLHFFVVFDLAAFIDREIVPLTNFYVAFAFNLVCFAMVAAVSYVSYRYFETIFLRMRIPYLDQRPQTENAATTDTEFVLQPGLEK